MTQKQEVYVQNPYLNKLIETETPVKIFMVNGFQIQGTIEAFDMYSISVRSNDKQQLLFKQAISTIQTEKPINWKQQEK
jgi:host factor-I protein